MVSKERALFNQSTQDVWLNILSRAPFYELEQWLALSKFQNLLSADSLNSLKNHVQITLAHDFVCQDKISDFDQYYETIIYQKQVIPTRPDSWHDLFNGLVWLQYPKSKALLNQWHMEDISKFGLMPRTKRRNNITHFDECGIILATSNRTIPDALAEHDWLRGLHANRHAWGRTTKAFVFGHANYEMLIAPFIGLTGKWLSIDVDEDFFELSFEQQTVHLDLKLCEQLQNEQDFSAATQLRPLPLLGIPQWWAQNIEPGFYANQDYFRPKRSTIMPTKQKLSQKA